MTVVRVALTQATWTGDRDSMVALHEEFTRKAAAHGAAAIAFQELFYGPYFGITQDPKYYQYAESVPGPTTERFAALARELGMVIILPVYEQEQPGVLYNTVAVLDSDGSYLGKYRKHHIPHLPKFWEKFYFRPGNLGWPVFETAIGKVGINICYDRHFPEGWRALGLGGAQIVFNPNATAPGISNKLWEIEQPAAAVANGYFVVATNRVGLEDNEFGDAAVNFYGRSYVVGPDGEYVGDVGSSTENQVFIRDIDLDQIRVVRERWQFYRDRRPEAYGPLVAP
jgi:beta-ureidopropionase